MIDTLLMTTSDYHIDREGSEGLTWTLRPFRMIEEKEVLLHCPSFNHIEPGKIEWPSGVLPITISKGMGNFSIGNAQNIVRVTVEPYQKSGDKTDKGDLIKISTELPSLLKKDRGFIDELTPDETIEAVLFLVEFLRTKGIYLNIKNLNVSRIDFYKTVTLKFPVRDYIRVLDGHSYGRQSSSIAWEGTGRRWGNKTRSIEVYDKIKNNSIKNYGIIGNATNRMRAELKLFNTTATKPITKYIFGKRDIMSFLERPEILKSYYNQEMNKLLSNKEADERDEYQLYLPSMREYIQEMKNNNRIKSKEIAEKAVIYMLKCGFNKSGYNIKEIISAFLNELNTDIDDRRAKSEIKQYAFMFIDKHELDTIPTETSKILYDELRNVLLA